MGPTADLLSARLRMEKALGVHMEAEVRRRLWASASEPGTFSPAPRLPSEAVPRAWSSGFESSASCLEPQGALVLSLDRQCQPPQGSVLETGILRPQPRASESERLGVGRAPSAGETDSQEPEPWSSAPGAPWNPLGRSAGEAPGSPKSLWVWQGH